MNGKGFVVGPLVAVPDKHIHVDIACLSRQLTPLVHRRLHLVLADHLHAVSLIAGYHTVSLSV